MALIERAAHDTQRAFDSVAAGYHRANEENPVLRAMRRQVIGVARRFVPAGSALLDLGCGPGTDLAELARSGYRVTAVDSSPRMVLEARGRADAEGLAGVEVRHLGIEEIDRLAPRSWDAALSNFGPLNCVVDLPRAARRIGERLRPGGVLIASVIGRVCPWEIALYLSRRDWRRLRVRFARRAVPVPLNGGQVWTSYYTPGEFERPFVAAGFRREHLRALALFAPPPYLDAFAARHPRLVSRLQAADVRLGRFPGLRACGDHFLVVLRRI